MRSPMTAARTRRAAISAAVLSAVTSVHICPGRAGSAKLREEPGGRRWRSFGVAGTP
jgi:hypothetical protein